MQKTNNLIAAIVCFLFSITIVLCEVVSGVISWPVIIVGILLAACGVFGLYWYLKN